MKKEEPSMPQSRPRYEQMYPDLLAFSILILLAGFCLDSPSNILTGLRTIILTEDALITDYVRIAGPGAALVNSAIVTAITVFILRYSGEPFNGTTLVVVGLMAGFSLFGKNFLNIWPILAGTWLYCKTRRVTFGKFAYISLMATALSPIISYIVLDNGWGSLPLALLVGVVIGFVMGPLSAYTYKVQNGMNLYNVGFACGLVAMMLVPVMASLGATPAVQYNWAVGLNRLFAPLVGGLCLLLILLGCFACRKPLWAVWAGYQLLLKTSGRSPSDFLRMFGPAPVLVNMGVNGLIGMFVLLLTGGDLNGPTIGGILTIMGFSAFGKHALNITPVMAGVILGSVVMRWSLDDSATQLAILFCTTLAPISGYFGWPYGILAGFLHSAVVLFTSSPVAGMNLYNNGFSGGLIAIVLYPLIIDIFQHRNATLENKDFFDSVTHDEPLPPEDSE